MKIQIICAFLPGSILYSAYRHGKISYFFLKFILGPQGFNWVYAGLFLIEEASYHLRMLETFRNFDPRKRTAGTLKQCPQIGKKNMNVWLFEPFVFGGRTLLYHPKKKLNMEPFILQPKGFEWFGNILDGNLCIYFGSPNSKMMFLFQFGRSSTSSFDFFSRHFWLVRVPSTIDASEIRLTTWDV